MAIAIILAGLISVILSTSYSAQVFGQGGPPPGYTSYSISDCGVNLSYPTNWTSIVKTGRFDIDNSGELVVKDPVDGLPKFEVLACNLSEGEQSLSIETAANILQNSLLDSYHVGYDMSLVEETHILKGLIDGRDTTVFALAAKYTNPDIPNVGSETYIVQNGNTKHGFTYYDRAADFDSPESKDIRDKILKSIKFVS